MFVNLTNYFYISRLQLVVCVNTIIKHDFPGRWTQIVDKISIYLQNPEGEKIYGALLCLYQLVKNFVYVFSILILYGVDGMDSKLSFCRYKKREERVPLNEAMHLLLPMTYNLMLGLMPDQSEKSVLLQKQVLKVFYSLIQVSLSTKYDYCTTFTRFPMFNSVVNFSMCCRWKLLRKRYSHNGWK